MSQEQSRQSFFSRQSVLWRSRGVDSSAGLVSPGNSPASISVRKEFALIRQRGYSIDNEEAYLGSRCIGAPIFESSGKIAAALSVSGPTTRVTRERVPAFASLAKNAAMAISKTLGYSVPEKALEARFGS